MSWVAIVVFVAVCFLFSTLYFKAHTYYFTRTYELCTVYLRESSSQGNTDTPQQTTIASDFIHTYQGRIIDHKSLGIYK